MSRLLIGVFVVLAGWSIAYWGRYRAPLKRNSRTDNVLGIINVICIALLCLIAATLPLSTGFVGIPVLGFAAAALFLASLFLYRIRAADLRMVRASGRGRRGLPVSQREMTRWPYTLVYMIGYVLLAAYIATILGHL